MPDEQRQETRAEANASRRVWGEELFNRITSAFGFLSKQSARWFVIALVCLMFVGLCYVINLQQAQINAGSLKIDALQKQHLDFVMAAHVMTLAVVDRGDKRDQEVVAQMKEVTSQMRETSRVLDRLQGALDRSKL